MLRMAAGAVRPIVVILAGGSGTRLWPASTDERPKQFLPLAGKASLLRQAYERALRLAGGERILISARTPHVGLVRRELPELPDTHIVLEPARRNTAPAIALTILLGAGERAEAVVAVLPSDHAVRDEEAFLAALRIAVETAGARDVLVTVGIPPVRPETGFGYIEADPADVGKSVRKVLRFVEKPDRETAERFIASGNFLWNAGVFAFRKSILLEEMARSCPGVLEAALRAAAARRAGDRPAFEEAFSAAPSISFDYAVMERSGRVVTVPCSCGWSDLGSWDTVFEFRGGREGTNVMEGPGICLEGTGNLVLAGGRPVRVVGLSDVTVVDAPDGVLVMRRGVSEALRKSVEKTLAEKET
jgi:mannose-1-phosphate guanylyltransferase/mannose-6-phosphate isomerase